MITFKLIFMKSRVKRFFVVCSHPLGLEAVRVAVIATVVLLILLVALSLVLMKTCKKSRPKAADQGK